MTDETALREAVGAYLDGLHRSDADLLARVFLPQGRIFAMAAGAVVDLPRDAWLDRVRARPDFRAQGIEAPFEIHELRVETPTTAFACLTSTVPPARFLDYLNFLKVDGRWRIVAKLYHRHD